MADDFFSLLTTAPVKRASAADDTDFFGMVTTPGNAARPAADPYAEPDAKTWTGQIAQSVRGKQDPRYADVGAYSGDNLKRLGAGMVTHDDAAYGDIIKSTLGNRLIRSFKDANGYDLIEYRGEGADADKAYRAYINKPGLDRFDVSRGLASAAPFALGAGAAGGIAALGGIRATGAAGLRGVGLMAPATSAAVPVGIAGRAALQGATAAGISVADDVVAGQAGSTQGIDPIRAGLFGGLGAAGEVAGAVVKPFLDKRAAGKLAQNGMLTPEGEAAAVKAGLDPTALRGQAADEFARTYAMTGDQAAAAVGAQRAEFNIPTTAGQRSKKMDLLHNEEAMRRNLKGEGAQNAMLSFDQAQREAIDTAARETVAGQLAPGRALRPGLDETGGAIGQALSTSNDIAKTGERAAWNKPIAATAEADTRLLMADIIDGRLADMTIDAQLTPASSKMGQILESYIFGDKQNLSTGLFGAKPREATVDEMRRKLGGLISSAANDADRKAAKQIYAGYNDWIKEAAEQSLLQGDSQAAANLRKAIDYTAEFRGLFNPRDMAGRDSPAAKVLERVMASDATPERIVQTLFGAGNPKASVPPAGTVEALQAMKRIFTKYNPGNGVNPFDDVRLAYWTRLVQNAKGEMRTPTEIVNNIQGALSNQNSVLQTLYSKSEIDMFRRFSAEVGKAAYKPPNASGSSYGVQGFAQEFGRTALKALGVVSGGLMDKIVLALLRPVGNEMGRAQARKALAQETVKRTPARFAPYGAAGGAVTGNALFGDSNP